MVVSSLCLWVQRSLILQNTGHCLGVPRLRCGLERDDSCKDLFPSRVRGIGR